MAISKRSLISGGSWGFLFGVSPVLPGGISAKARRYSMADRRITKRVVDGLKPGGTEFAVWDSKLPGFGVRVRPTGAMSYVVVYRSGSGPRRPRPALHHREGREDRTGGRQTAGESHSGSGRAWPRSRR